ncbi:MAG: BrnA antitoxin family protein [Coxiellaceae bacterium]|nr:BrnA antitoxin family protein [Coxiellaceae bacterium]
MSGNKKPTKTDLKKLDSIRDNEIDYSDIPELDDEFFEKAKRIKPEPKQSLTVRYDKEVVDYFRKKVGKGYQSKMNAILKAYVQHQKQRKRG